MQHPLYNFRQLKFSSISCQSNLSIGEHCYSIVLTVQRQDSLQSKTFDSYGLRSLLSYENQLMPYGSLMSLLCMVITLAKSNLPLVPLRTKSKNVHERTSNLGQTSLTNMKDLLFTGCGRLGDFVATCFYTTSPHFNSTQTPFISSEGH